MKKAIYPILAALCVLALIGMTAALILTGKSREFTPPPFDPAAQEGTPAVSPEAGYGEMDAKAFCFSVAGELFPQNGRVDLWLTNPAENSVWLKVRILDESGAILGESGLIRPGEYVRSVNLHTQPQSSVKVVLKIMAYEPETYYSAGSAVLNTSLQIA